MKPFIFAVLMLLPMVALADNGWISIAENSQGTTFELQKGSLTIDTNDKGVAVAIAIERAVNGNHIDFAMVGLPITLCSAGFGRISAFDMTGKPTDTFDVVIGGGTIASRIAEAVCAGVKATAATNNKPTSSANL